MGKRHYPESGNESETVSEPEEKSTAKQDPLTVIEDLKIRFSSRHHFSDKDAVDVKKELEYLAEFFK
jgi:hypothetical protein